MSIFSRFFKIGQASVNKALDKMEKPELMLEQAIRDKEVQIRDAKKSVQSCIATERQTKKLLDTEKAEQLAWEQRAQAALKSGKEDLAVKALQRATEHEQKVGGLQQNWETQKTGVEDLKRDIHGMEEQLAEYKRNKDFIIAQAKAAEVKKGIYEAKARIAKKSNNADDLMARMKAKAERSEVEAEAAQEIAGMGEDTLEKQFDELDSSSANPAVQDKLAAMKAKLNQGA
ncbi:MAG: PspA/IM30 family protein [Opitutales bacterium]|nr:PspA/IM30 family protein [Opitutales bacterium]NRA26020.1 PspA/IM30 family protein [Opitutales bacterium]